MPCAFDEFLVLLISVFGIPMSRSDKLSRLSSTPAHDASPCNIGMIDTRKSTSRPRRLAFDPFPSCGVAFRHVLAMIQRLTIAVGTWFNPSEHLRATHRRSVAKVSTDLLASIELHGPRLDGFTEIVVNESHEPILRWLLRPSSGDPSRCNSSSICTSAARGGCIAISPSIVGADAEFWV